MFLYTTAMGYPNNPTNEDKDAVKGLVNSMRNLLPCEKCRHNLTSKLNGPLGDQLEEATQCSEKLVRFVYDLESSVAEMNGKTMQSFENVVRGVMTNTYKQPPTAAVRSSITSSQANNANMTALWVLLPLGIVVASLVTWLVTRRVLLKK